TRVSPRNVRDVRVAVFVVSFRLSVSLDRPLTLILLKLRPTARTPLASRRAASPERTRFSHRPRVLTARIDRGIFDNVVPTRWKWARTFTARLVKFTMDFVDSRSRRAISLVRATMLPISVSVRRRLKLIASLKSTPLNAFDSRFAAAWASL